jgi:hypothetical protein
MAFPSQLVASLALATALAACSPAPDESAVVPRESRPKPRPAATRTADVVPPLAAAAAGEIDAESADAQASTVPDGPRALLRRLPRSSLVVLRLPRLDKLREAWDRTALSTTFQALLEDPELGALLGGAGPGALPDWSTLTQTIVDQVPELRQLCELAPQLGGELVVALTRAGPAGGGVPVSLSVLYDAQGRAADLQRALEPLLARPRTPGGQKLERRTKPWGFALGDPQALLDVECRGEVFSALFGPPELVRAERSEHEAWPESHSFVASEVARATPDFAREGATVVLEAYLNLAPLRELASVAIPPDVLGRIRAAGLLRIEGASAAVALDAKGLSEALVWCSPDQRDFVSRALTAKPLDRSMARWIPAEADSGGLYALDVESLLTDVRVLLPDEVRREMDRGIDDLLRFRGIDLRRELFANVGPTVAFASRGDLQSWLSSRSTPWCVAIQVRDEAAARRLMDAAGAAIPGAPVPSAATVAGADVRTIELDARAAELAGGLKSLSWTVAGGCLVIASDTELLASCLESAKGERTRNAAFLEALERAGESAWCVGLAWGGAGLPPTMAVGRRTDLALVLEAREGSGALAASGVMGFAGGAAAVAIPMLLQARMAAAPPPMSMSIEGSGR